MTAGFTLSEFSLLFAEDPNLRVLVVEGDRDLTFWRALVPDEERGDIAIYKIGSIEVEVEEGGERGRLVRCAEILGAAPIGDRVRFFADSDGCRILGVALPGNVIATDGRDLESYGLSKKCVRTICMTGFNWSEAEADAVWDGIVNTVRPIGVLRMASSREGLKLPFSRTFDHNGRCNLRKYFVKNGKPRPLDLERLIKTLIINSKNVNITYDEIIKKYYSERDTLIEISEDEIIQGKDYIAYLSYIFRCNFDQANAYLNLGIGVLLGEIRIRENLAMAERWVRAA